MLLDRVAAFTEDLRSAGVPVSTSELLDAVAATEAIGLNSRTQWRNALCCSLIKREEHLTIFATAFEVNFPVHRSVDGPRQFVDDLIEAIEAAVLEEDEDTLLALIQQAVLQYGGMNDGRFLGPDYHVRRVLRQLRESQALAIGAPGDGLVDPGPARIEAMVTEEVMQQAIEAGHGDELMERATSLSPQHLEFLRASPQDLARLDALVQALGRRLAARLRRQRTHGRRGRLNASATVRRSLASGGVPFDPVFRATHPRRPTVLVLADVSGSVANFARFTLRLVHAMSGEFRQVRTFAFVDEVDELTRWFANADFDDAMHQVAIHARTTGVEGHSDYGNAFARFTSSHLDAVSSSTTVLILGDGRNNYHPVNAAELKRIKLRARSVYWLNPEPRAHWDTADSVIGEYEKHCDKVLECRNLQQLTVAISELT